MEAHDVNRHSTIIEPEVYALGAVVVVVDVGLVHNTILIANQENIGVVSRIGGQQRKERERLRRCAPINGPECLLGSTVECVRYQDGRVHFCEVPTSERGDYKAQSLDPRTI